MSIIVTRSGKGSPLTHVEMDANFTNLNTGKVETTDTIAVNRGGTNITTYATGDIIYASATNTLSKLAAGTNGYVLTLASGVPTWVAASGGAGNAYSWFIS